MIRYFCADCVLGKSTKGLFDSLEIAKVDAGKYLKMQGQFPTIYLSFKDIKNCDFEGIKERIKRLIASCYKDHAKILLRSTILGG